MLPSEAQRRSPYQGLIPYGETDAPFFFGREREARLITANLFASTLTLLYGASGVGKSSVLRAGVAHQLREREDLLIVVFNSWQGDATTGLKTRVAEIVARVDSKIAPPSNGESLVEYLSRCAEQTNRRLMIILDQFEEYFLYHPQNDSFAEEFPRAITQTGAPVSFLISIREDFYAKLDRFEDRIPALYSNYLRIEHLDTRAARAAIEKPVAQYNNLYANGQPMSLEPQLVEAVLKQVRTGQDLLGGAGRGVVEASKTEDETEAGIVTPYLQLVMTRLWDEEMREGSSKLRLATLNKLGGAESIVRTHLDNVMNVLQPADQDIAARIFHYLVTPSGTKIAYIAPDLAASTKVSQGDVVRVLERLSSSDVRILRPIDPLPDNPTEPRYEIFHDVLARAILTWRTKFVQAQERADAERQLAIEAEERAKAEKQLARERTLAKSLRWAVIGMVLLLFAMGGLTVWAFEQRGAANRQRLIAETAKADAENKSIAAANAEAEARKQSSYAQESLKGEQQAKHELEKKNAYAEEQRRLADKQRKNAEEFAAAAQIARANAEKALAGFKIAEEARKAAEKETEDQRTVAALTKDLRGAETLLQTVPSKSTSIATNVIERFRMMDKEDAPPVADAADVLRRSLLAQLGANLKAELRGHAESVQTAAFSPDGKLIATGSDDNGVRLWNASDGKFIGKLAEPDMTAPIESVTFNQDSTLLLIKATDNTIHIHDARTGIRVQELNGVDVKFSADGRAVVVAHNDETVKVWSKGSDVIEEYRPAKRMVFRGMAEHTWLSSDGAFALEIFGARAQVWEVKTGQGVSFDAGNEGTSEEINSVAFSPDNTLVALGSKGGQVRVWNTRGTGDDATLKIKLEDQTGAVSSVAFSPDNKLLATVDAEGTTRVWRTETEETRVGKTEAGENVATLWDETEEVTSATFSPDSKYVITMSSDGAVRVWEIEREALYAVLRGHTGPINNLAFNSKGDALLTASFDGTARLWDWQPETWRTKPLVLAGHQNNLKSAIFLPDNKSVLTTSYDDTARVWNASNGQPISTSAHVDGDFQEFSSDGQLIAVADKQNLVTIKDVLTGRTWSDKSAHTGDVRSIAFSRDGRFAVTASADNTAIVWNAETGKTVASLGVNVRDIPGDQPVFLNPVLGAAFSPDGKHVVTWSQDNNARVWDWQTESGRRKPLLLSGHRGRILDVSFNADGSLIVTASADRTARVWNATTGKLIAILPQHKTPVLSASFSQDSKFVVTAEVYAARVWELPTTNVEGQEAITKKFELTGKIRPVTGASFSPDGKLVLVAGRGAQLWDATTGDSLAELTGHEGKVTSAKFSSDGKLILTAGMDKTARVWDVPENISKGQVLHERVTLTGERSLMNATWSSDGKSIFTFANKSVQKWDWQTESGRSQPVKLFDGENAASSPDGRYVGSASNVDTTRVWETGTGRKLMEMSDYAGRATKILFSPDNRLVAEALVNSPSDGIGDDYFHVLVWEVATGRNVGEVGLPPSEADCMAFSEDAKTLAIGSNGHVLVFDTGTAAQKYEAIEAHNGKINSVAFSPDGKYVVSEGEDKIARVWEVATGKLFKELRGHFRGVQSAVFSRDGKFVVTASKDKTARVWNVETGESVVLKGHRGTVNYAEFSLDGQFVVTASDDKTARLWNAGNGKLLAELVGHKGNVNTAKFSSDGRSIVTASNDMTARIFTCKECGSINELVEEANALAGKSVIQEEKKP
ncbi:MAG: hypothetical protein WCB68_21900 [Pyrinomonadaceae bacterium]